MCREVIGAMEVLSELDSNEGALHEGIAENKTDSKLWSGVFLLGTCRCKNDNELDCEKAITRVDYNDPSTLDDFLVLTKTDIPGVSLNGKQPQELNMHHSVYGDGTCLYHAIPHQAGFVDSSSRGCRIISGHLRQMIIKVTSDYPTVRLEDGLSITQWLKRQQAILNPAEWGGDLEVRLLAIGLKRDIVVLTDASNGATYARRFPCQPPPIPKMAGGIFIPVSTKELCIHWKSRNPQPLLTIYNGRSHYDSVVHLSG